MQWTPNGSYPSLQHEYNTFRMLTIKKHMLPSIPFHFECIISSMRLRLLRRFQKKTKLVILLPRSRCITLVMESQDWRSRAFSVPAKRINQVNFESPAITIYAPRDLAKYQPYKRINWVVTRQNAGIFPPYTLFTESIMHGRKYCKVDGGVEAHRLRGSRFLFPSLIKMFLRWNMKVYLHFLKFLKEKWGTLKYSRNRKDRTVSTWRWMRNLATFYKFKTWRRISECSICRQRNYNRLTIDRRGYFYSMPTKAHTTIHSLDLSIPAKD